MTETGQPSGTSATGAGPDPTPEPAASPPGPPVQLAEILPLLRLADMIAPMAVRAAATLRLADHIADGVTGLDELAAAASVDRDALRRLMRYLIARGVFTEAQPGRYALSGLAELLLDGHPARLRTRFDLDGPVGRGDVSFIHLLDSLRTGEPSFDRMYGRSFWEDIDADPRRVADFIALQSANSAQSGIEHVYDWSAVEHVMDVGGGDGTLIAQILSAHPHLRGTIVELPATAETARAALRQAGLAERCEVVDGSFFEPLPEGADVYMLSKILHDWADEESVAILRRCAAAAGGGGRVLIAEMIPPDDDDHRDFSYLDLHMLLYFGGKERTLEEYSELAAAAGMTVRRVDDHKWGASVLECTVG